MKAQDPIFSQAFLSPIYLNPAATGAGDHDLRVSAIYRRQWMTVPSQMNYMAISADKYVPGLESGFGFLVTRSSEGYLNKSGAYGTVARTFCASQHVAENDDVPRWFWTTGLQFGVAKTRVDFNKFVFADQLSANGIIPNYLSVVDLPINSGKLFPDFCAGMFFNYNLKENSRLLGISAHHLNRPDESLTGTSDSYRSLLPVRWTGSLLYSFTNLESSWTYSLTGIAYRQANNSSYQAGLEVSQHKVNMSLGLWYRGSVNFKNINTISMTLSINLSGRDNENDKLRAGVGHDAQVGNKNYSYTSGSSEIGFVWDHKTYNSEAGNYCKPRISSYICPGVNR